MIISAPGLYPNITPEQYFKGFTPTRALTQSGIKKLLTTTAADYRYGEDEDTAAKRRGDVVHQLALGKGSGIAVSDHKRWDRRMKETAGGETYAEFADRCEREDLTPIKRKDYAPAEEMALIIQEQICTALGCTDDAAYATEVPFAWKEDTPHGPVWCTGMMDVWCENHLKVIDPKITERVHSAERQVVAMGWDIQAAWYLRGLAKIFPDAAGRLTFKNLLISPKPPHTSRLVRITEGWRTNAERECERALQLFARCLHTNEWPGYPPEETLDEPPWSQAMRMQHEMEDAA